jgi:thiol-disulfide isomerase/thioredoxin
MKNGVYFGFLLALAIVLQGCLVADNPYSVLPPGEWRAVLKLVDRPVSPNPKGKPLPDKVNLKFEEVTDGELPFNFEVKYVNKDSFYIEVINGEERIVLDKITIGRDYAKAKDTIFIDIPVYDSYIHGIFEENIISGEWVVRSKENYRIPFLAHHGRKYRFTSLKKKPIADISGRWEAKFGLNETEPYPAIGEFKQKGNYLTGTFLTETGDYRFLEGTVQGNKLYLSCFDGSHAFLFEGKILDSNTMIGSYRSGNKYQTTWEAKRNEKAQLGDPEKLTFLKPGYSSFDFSFPDIKGKMTSPRDPAFKDKVKIIQIMGTWCPNCRDETNFLVNYLKKNPNDHLQVIALAFERYKDADKANHAIQQYQDYFKMGYPILLAGNSNKEQASTALPMLNAVLSYPTMLILDQKNNVRKIHTGFSGPATSQYKQFTEEFDRFVKELLTEVNVEQQ